MSTHNTKSPTISQHDHRPIYIELYYVYPNCAIINGGYL